MWTSVVHEKSGNENISSTQLSETKVSSFKPFSFLFESLLIKCLLARYFHRFFALFRKQREVKNKKLSIGSQSGDLGFGICDLWKANLLGFKM